ncbi:hypothetical protein GCM10009678_55060 [Actinomadura kijaniata]|uniref:Cu-Zn family superoxide dismutase n=1 Tax=Actinomadura namibiensis TaxID=182080 RepID=A0A7W3QK94_ACTNM|nr:superoxide dismutase family protein [Actinomadura namibiensis]MBA8950279.1 Cu-Zn family superoxide dismutase [Actinomadura namibiensis]
MTGTRRKLMMTALSGAGIAVGSVAAGGGAAAADGHSVVVEVRDTFVTTKVKDATSYTYDPALVPAGARVKVRSASVRGQRNVTTLWLGGLKPRTHFMAHVHVGRCGVDPLASGGHYQHRVGGPVDAENEVWFSVRTDARGNARASAAHNWTYEPGRFPESVVVHEHGPQARRIACASVPFAS